MVEYDLQKIPIVDLVNQIIIYAANHNASDIHLDPREDCLVVRMRIDGELRDHTIIPKEYERNLITRVKLISNMNITETRLPQDGAIKGRIQNKDLDMRVSALPTNEGEKVVIRILDFTKSLTGLDSLGFSPKNLELIQKMLAVPNGIILVTGATGTGKSTTTYSMLQALNKEGTNIITVEDPIEMNIEGVNQVQVNSEIGLSFATVLRSILRQDPNIILVGEIRDSETAQIAVRASITGHLVLSTIHTNNSLSTIERLLDMDVERYLLSSALTGIISQKLVKTLCPYCRKLRPATPYEEHFFLKILNQDVKEVYEAVGCEHCNHGYRGRMAVQEVLYITDHLRDVLSNPNIDKEELRKIVYNGETTTLLQDALLKAIAGYTTFDEVLRMVEVDADLEKTVEKEAEETKVVVKHVKEEVIPAETVLEIAKVIAENATNKNNTPSLDKPVEEEKKEPTKEISTVPKEDTKEIVKQDNEVEPNNTSKVNEKKTINEEKKEPTKEVSNVPKENTKEIIKQDNEIEPNNTSKVNEKKTINEEKKEPVKEVSTIPKENTKEIIKQDNEIETDNKLDEKKSINKLPVKPNYQITNELIDAYCLEIIDLYDNEIEIIDLYDNLKEA